MGKPSVKRWEDVDLYILGEAIFTVVKGDTSLMAEEVKSDTTVWAKIAGELGSRYSALLDRIWCKSAYLCNATRILVIRFCITF
jgi:hypothetical protein